MEEKNTREGKKHALSVVARERADIAGVIEVESFDEQCVVLKTDCGEMTVEGEGLRVGALDIAKGALEITGRIGAVCYSDTAPSKRGLR